jgi:hypothetical protein
MRPSLSYRKILDSFITKENVISNEETESEEEKQYFIISLIVYNRPRLRTFSQLTYKLSDLNHCDPSSNI